MVQTERTGNRDLEYSRWHRKLPNFCYMIDLDSIEWRNETGIAAFIETAYFNNGDRYTPKQIIERNKQFEIKVLNELQQLTKKPAFIVLHDQDLTTFLIYRILNGSAHYHKTFSASEYSQFLMSLGTKTCEVRT